MSLSKHNIVNFLRIPETVPLIDVRSPAEYQHAHIPGAHSLPIFDDDERREIGTAYKQVSREDAIKIGLKAFGPKMVRMVETVEKLANGSREIRVHCWRGGMRSGAVGWLLDLYGFDVHLLEGGYKSYRHHVLDVLGRNYHLAILGGCTGANKTGLLLALAKAGENVIDLESLAGHRGSAFGNLDLEPQPTQEYFENLLAAELEKHTAASQKTLWLEAESQRIGLINIPQPFFELMRRSPLVFLDVPFEERLSHIVESYGNYSKEKLVNAIIRIKKKLGGLETKTAVNMLIENDVRGCFAILLKYYDKLYLKSSGSPAPEERTIHTIRSETTDANRNLTLIKTHVNAI